jgi:hypothetical protein
MVGRFCGPGNYVSRFTSALSAAESQPTIQKNDNCTFHGYPLIDATVTSASGLQMVSSLESQPHKIKKKRSKYDHAGVYAAGTLLTS